MKIKFVQEARIDGKVAFEDKSVHDLAEASAQRWVRRGVAVHEVDSKLEEVAHKISDKIKEAASTVVEKLDSVVNKEQEFEHSDGAAQEELKKDETVANDASVEENKANKKAQANKNVKGL